jgi:hypothetical protein
MNVHVLSERTSSMLEAIGNDPQGCDRTRKLHRIARVLGAGVTTTASATTCTRRHFGVSI